MREVLDDDVELRRSRSIEAVAARFDAPLTVDAVLALRSAPVAAENLAEVIDRTPPGPLRDAWVTLRDIDGGHS